MSQPLKIVKKKLSSLKTHPINRDIYTSEKSKVRQQEQEALKNSIYEIGLLNPLVVNSNDIVISGHRRLRALRELGEDKVLCRVIDYQNETIALIESNKQRTKDDWEKAKEAELWEKELKKYKKTERPFINQKGVMNIYKELDSKSPQEIATKIVGLSPSQYRKMMVVKKNEPQLFGKEDMSVNEAYNLSKKQPDEKPKTKMDIKMDEVEKYSPELKNQVDAGLVKPTEAYNIMNKDISQVSEYRSHRGQYKKTSLKKEVDKIHTLYGKPKLDEWLEALKEIFPFNLPDRLK